VLFEILVGERMGRSSPDPRRHDEFLQQVRLRLLDALGGAGAGVVEIVSQMLAHSPSLRPNAEDVRARCQKLLRFLDPIDVATWAAEVAGGLAKARSESFPQSPDWPERVGRSEWAGDYESTEALLWSTSGNIALETEEEDTHSVVFADQNLLAAELEALEAVPSAPLEPKASGGSNQLVLIMVLGCILVMVAVLFAVGILLLWG
jgi:hypothetical protein